LFLLGERDVFVSPKFEKGLQPIADGNPNVRLVRIPDAGHLPWLDDPDQVVAEIERFLASQPRSGVSDISPSTRRAGHGPEAALAAREGGARFRR
jgi:hypothetical protein